MKTLDTVIAQDYQNLASIMILKDESLLYSHSFNHCTNDNKLHIYSVTKSIVSILIGIAIDHGFIKDVNQKIIDFFPEYQKMLNCSLNTTIKDILTMTASYRYDDSLEIYQDYFLSHDKFQFTINQLTNTEKQPNFRYTPIIGPDILSAILRKATHLSVRDFANQYLFAPLNIHIDNDIVINNADDHQAFTQSVTNNGWVIDHQGLHPAGWGLTLSVSDLLKIGQLFLNNGIYNQQQVVSSQWLNASTQVHSYSSQLALGYGYYWWITKDNKPSIAAIGDGGNTLYINKAENLIIAITALYQGNTVNMLPLIETVILPMLQ